MITILNKKSDELGILSSVLCIIHCIATPLVLTVVSSSSMINQENTNWWSWLDILFLAISMIAVIKTFQRPIQKWLRISLVASWFLLSFFILNERWEGIEFPLDMAYFPAFALIIFHIINIRQCRCKIKQ